MRSSVRISLQKEMIFYLLILSISIQLSSLTKGSNMVMVKSLGVPERILFIAAFVYLLLVCGAPRSASDQKVFIFRLGDPWPVQLWSTTGWLAMALFDST